MFAIETVKFRAAQQIYCVKHQMKIPFEIGNFSLLSIRVNLFGEIFMKLQKFLLEVG